MVGEEGVPRVDPLPRGADAPVGPVSLAAGPAVVAAQKAQVRPC